MSTRKAKTGAAAGAGTGAGGTGFQVPPTPVLPPPPPSLPLPPPQPQPKAQPASNVSIDSVGALGDITVACGTPFDKLGLKAEVLVKLTDNSQHKLGITWDLGQPPYDDTVPGGTYQLTGALVLPSSIGNPKGCEAIVKVTVGHIITKVDGLSNMAVDNGTPIAKAKSALPQEVGIDLSNGTHVIVHITWDNGSPSYDGNTAGLYAFSGTLTLPAGITDPNGIRTSVTVAVGEPTVVSVEAIADISVPYGTLLGTVKASSLPARVNVKLSDGTTNSLPVAWDDGSPTYIGKPAGRHAFTGTMTMEKAITNPKGYTAKVYVIIGTKAPNRKLLYSIIAGVVSLIGSIVWHALSSHSDSPTAASVSEARAADKPTVGALTVTGNNIVTNVAPGMTVNQSLIIYLGSPAKPLGREYIPYDGELVPAQKVTN